MMARIRKSMDEKDKGFTLIELLVVVIIIGILAAIAIPVFMNQRKKAVDSSIKSDLRTVATALETYYTDNQEYIAATGTAGTITLGAAGAEATKLSPGNVVTVTVSTAKDSYCIKGTNPKGTDTTNGFFYSSKGGGLMPAGTTACTP
ncbi:prepilin-type N-terminal cleavage/methylation domain-containing protein [Cellulosimicrobium cellulans]|uniref:prepilin-type N-terminal cleavage/methylation domain-containing protein n=1 Tax=Cellulosimicrobium cellulans TaxID=1710 RepID=UPI00130E983F|nr:prepilin-type N-terminal cleavage/methylation domain-containing protein [Cellulosimicrobium cellulans]